MIFQLVFGDIVQTVAAGFLSFGTLLSMLTLLQPKEASTTPSFAFDGGIRAHFRLVHLQERDRV